jgi:hypothetical protein
MRIFRRLDLKFFGLNVNRLALVFLTAITKKGASSSTYAFKWSQRESNPHLKFRKLLFYPLNYETSDLDCEYRNFRLNFKQKSLIPSGTLKLFTNMYECVLAKMLTSYYFRINAILCLSYLTFSQDHPLFGN